MALAEYVFEMCRKIFYYPLPDKILSMIALFLFFVGFSFVIASLYKIIRKLLEKYTTPFGKYEEGFFGAYMKIKDIGVAASISAVVGVFIMLGIFALSIFVRKIKFAECKTCSKKCL